MKKLLVILFAIFAVTAASAQVMVEDVNYPKVGDNAPNFTVTLVDGTNVTLADLKGKVVLVNFWATWCPPCRSELKRVPEEIVEKFAKDDFVLIAISVGEDKETVMKFREENGYKFTMGLDTDKEIIKLYAKSGIPRNFLIGRDGKIAAAEVGYSPELFGELISKIAEALK